MSLTEHESLKSFMLSQMLVIIASLEFKRNSWTSKAYFFEDGTWRPMHFIFLSRYYLL